MYSNYPNQNHVRDFDKVQGTTHPSDLHVQIRRDVNLRYITVENSSTRPRAVAITTYISGPTPQILFTLAAGEIKHLGINSQGGPPQFIWLLDVQTGMPVGASTLIRSNSNQLVIRDGLNKSFIHFFARPSYAAAK